MIVDHNRTILDSIRLMAKWYWICKCQDIQIF